MNCPHCNRQAIDGELFCSNCGTALFKRSFQTVDIDTLSAVDVTQSTTIDSNAILNRSGLVYLGDETHHLETIRHRAYIGRDPKELPETDLLASFIDVTAFGGHLMGISRLHARLDVDKDGNYRIIDLRSTNGTKVNDVRLEAFQSYPLKENDHVWLGNFHIQVLYRAYDTVTAEG
jgi:hypothetical protein